MKYLGLFNGLPLYEIVKGTYVIINVEHENVMFSRYWLGHLSRYGETFTRGGENPDDEKCIEIIEKNKDRILEAAEDFSKGLDSDEMKAEFKQQDDFYNWLEEGREYNCYSGKYSDEMGSVKE